MRHKTCTSFLPRAVDAGGHRSAPASHAKHAKTWKRSASIGAGREFLIVFPVWSTPWPTCSKYVEISCQNFFPCVCNVSRICDWFNAWSANTDASVNDMQESAKSIVVQEPNAALVVCVMSLLCFHLFQTWVGRRW